MSFLKEFNFNSVFIVLSKEDLTILLQHIASNTGYPSKLRLSDGGIENIDKIDGILLGRAFARLEEIILETEDCELEESLLVKMFNTLDSEVERRLHTVEIKGVNLSCIDPDLLSRVLVTLKSVTLRRGNMTRVQTETFFRVLAEGGKKKLTLA